MDTYYRLTYLNYKGRAELIRFILAYAEVDFEDCRIEPEEWPKYRPKTPYGILPILDYDGNIMPSLEFEYGSTLSGNGPIARYLAEKHGVAGSGAASNAEIYSIVDCVEDLWQHMFPVIREWDETRRGELKKAFIEQYLPVPLTKLEETAAQNGTPEGWVFGKKVTYADFAICVLLETLSKHQPTVLDSFPTLTKLKTSVEQIPSIDKWIKTRPETPY